MRRIAFSIIFFSALAIWPAHTFGQTVSNTVAATFNWASYDSKLISVKKLTITPITPYPGYPWPGVTLPHQPLPNIYQVPETLTFSVAKYTQMTNGNLTVSNLFNGYPYLVEMTDYYSSYDYTNYFDVSLNGLTVDASTNQAFVVGAVIFPRGAKGADGTNTVQVSWGTLTNQSTARPATLYFYFPPSPYTSNNYPHGILTTN